MHFLMNIWISLSEKPRNDRRTLHVSIVSEKTHYQRLDVFGTDGRPHDLARRQVRRVRLASYANWKAYCASDKKPANIPSHPELVYAKEGWINWNDWLGLN